MKKSSFILVIMSLIIIVAVLTNPDQDRHKEVIKNKLLTSLQKSMKQNQTQINDWEEAGQTLGIILGGVIIDGLLNNLMSTDNYVLFSTTKITWEGERKLIGIGALGNVFITRKLDEALNKGLLKN